MTFIDARIHSNISRFLNHSCRPLLIPFLFVRNKENSFQYPQLGFIFKNDVAAGTELTIDYGKDFWKMASYDCCCGNYDCLRPSVNTRYRMPAENNRANKCYGKEAKLDSRLAREAQLCEERLKLLRQGKSRAEVMFLVPTKHDKKLERVRPYTRNDRCPSPLMPGVELIDLDSD